MNYFIDTFLEVITNSQGDMIEELKINKDLLLESEKHIEKDLFFKGKNKVYKEILFIMAQNHFFSVSNDGFTVQSLAKGFSKSEQYIRSILLDLYENGMIRTEGKRPVHYFMNEKYFD